jgi:hypothetical protein
MNRATLIARLALLTGVSVALPTLLACLDHPLKRVEYEQSVEDEEGIAISVNKDVDILFMIDNSGSMGEEQGNLSENFGAFINVLEAPDVKANYRIGITTTDNGNRYCLGTGPEAGNFVFSSCRQRLPDFEFVTDGINAEFACTDFCPAEWDTITQKPSAIKGSAEESRRPWIESIEGATNLPDGLSTLDAMQCLAPQGINGCGFESHLESMYLALRRANMEGEDELGFLRDNAILSIVFVTDEVDCSNNKLWDTIFDTEADGGNEVFWSIPGENQPSSAVCWNAGVQCEPAGASTYDSCVPANKDFEGNPVPDSRADDDAVLYPVSRYVDLVQELEDAKQDLNPGQEVLVAAITGVPTNYPTGEITYAVGPNAADSTSFQAKFGIAPGCSTPGLAEAVPPVRIKAFADAFLISDDDVNLFSVCKPSYEDALKAIADAIRDQIRPACMRACVADVDPVQEGLQPQCVLEESYRDENNDLITNKIPQCGAGDAIPQGAGVCYTPLTDKDGLTGTTDDDMQDACIDEGWNLEFRLVRREGVPAPGGAQANATCQLSQNKAVDCPGLPG